MGYGMSSFSLLSPGRQGGVRGWVDEGATAGGMEVDGGVKEQWGKKRDYPNDSQHKCEQWEKRVVTNRKRASVTRSDFSEGNTS